MPTGIVDVDGKALAESAGASASPREIVQNIQKAIATSFKEERLRGEVPVVSDREIKRRVELCWKWYRIMRHDCGFSNEKAFDFLATALRKALDNVAWEPPKGSSWGAQ